MLSRRSIIRLVLLPPLALLTGCTTSLACQPMPGRSLALDAPAQQQLARNEPADTLPWYAARNDVQNSVTVGVQGPTYQQSVTYSYDQVNSYDGQVYQNYNETTYRRSVRETAH